MSEQNPNEPLPTTPVEPPAAAPSGPPEPPAPSSAASPPWGPPPQWGAPPPGWGPPSWAAPPPAPVPPPPPRRDRAALAVVVFIFGGLFLVFFAFLWLAYSAVKGEAPRLATGPRVGIVEVKGAIGMGGRDGVDSETVLRVIRRFRNDGDIKAVVVRVDSPGGAVAPSQEIYDELRALSASGKVVVCSLGNVAASGGLYVAMGCPLIVAEPGTLTGSIGVISQFFTVKGLLERFQVKAETVKSGKLKDAGNPFRDMSPEDRAYWQALVDQVYGQFVRAVAESRELSEEQVRAFADGRVITGETAKELDLIDELGSFQRAVELALEEAEQKGKGEPTLVYPPEDRGRFLEQLMGGVVGAIADGVRAEIRRDIARVETPGVFYLAR